MEKKFRLTCPFFIDDLANKWVNLDKDGKIKPKEDWGYAGFDENGASHFLLMY